MSRIVKGFFLMFFMFVILATSSFADIKYSNSKYNCSFTLKGEKWQKNSGPVISLVGSGLVEYIDLAIFSYLTFTAEVSDIGVVKTIGTTMSILKGRSRSFTFLRQESYRVGDAIGRWGQFLFTSLNGSSQMGFYTILRQQGVNYQFILSGSETKSAVMKRKLIAILSSFKVVTSKSSKSK